MPYKIVKRIRKNRETPFYFVVKDDGEIMGVHRTRKQAREQQKALYASESD